MQTPKDNVKKRTNLSIQLHLISEAKELGINLSASAEHGIAQAIASEKKRRWLQENNSALSSSNLYVEENGLPLSKYRLF
ncbi:type II toxin-antitoxin system CcdA family antitoxin [Paraglaciecola sp. 25GB23A]|uniref:type II toxin-antitoxin system CcdA family antitoxin n=1 Tax=Paraglaciecola sp. 25GB23A TaxID=3156068 RepID=UPI0032AF1929